LRGGRPADFRIRQITDPPCRWPEEKFNPATTQDWDSSIDLIESVDRLRKKA
jgi:hypothetical protein